VGLFRNRLSPASATEAGFQALEIDRIARYAAASRIRALHDASSYGPSQWIVGNPQGRLQQELISLAQVLLANARPSQEPDWRYQGPKYRGMALAAPTTLLPDDAVVSLDDFPLVDPTQPLTYSVLPTPDWDAVLVVHREIAHLFPRNEEDPVLEGSDPGRRLERLLWQVAFAESGEMARPLPGPRVIPDFS
jgi:hypothetical protein